MAIKKTILDARYIRESRDTQGGGVGFAMIFMVGLEVEGGG